MQPRDEALVPLAQRILQVRQMLLHILDGHQRVVVRPFPCQRLGVQAVQLRALLDALPRPRRRLLLGGSSLVTPTPTPSPAPLSSLAAVESCARRPLPPLQVPVECAEAAPLLPRAPLPEASPRTSVLLRLGRRTANHRHRLRRDDARPSFFPLRRVTVASPTRRIKIALDRVATRLQPLNCGQLCCLRSDAAAPCNPKN